MPGKWRIQSRSSAQATSASAGVLFFVIRAIMDIEVKFDGEEIIVTKPGTEMMTAYRKASDRPNLILTRSWVEPTVTSPAIAEFRAPPFR